MKNKHILSVILLILVIPAICFGNSHDEKVPGAITLFLQKEFDLAGNRIQEAQFYLIETRLIHYALDGKRTGTDTFMLRLEYTPAGSSGSGKDQYICRSFTLQKNSSSPVSIPALEGWSYTYVFGYDEEGRVFGIDHDRFENLKTEDGSSLPPNSSYFIYNTFIDFHGFCNVFAEKIEGGNGIQDLKHIGDRIIHAAANTEPPVNLGSNVAEGSTFKNGEATLEFRGISLVDGRLCSIVAFDSGESSFNMIMRPMPEMEIKTVGSSHYKGDLFIDMESNWVRKVIMGEIVISETTLPMSPDRINSVIERSTIIRSVNKPDLFIK